MTGKGCTTCRFILKLRIVRQHVRRVFGAGVLFFTRSARHRGGGGKQKMADGVDHIDIYADVEEEFNEVRFHFEHLYLLNNTYLRAAPTD